jgi:cytochrome c-type biogenesis protein CcmH
MLASRRSGARAAPALPLEARDLEGKRDALVRQLRELEDTGSKRTPEQLARERYALELEAAHVLLSLDERLPSTRSRRAAHRARPGEPAAAPSPRAGLRGFLWGMGSAAAVALLAALVYQSTKPREAGGSLTGNLPMGKQGQEPGATDAEEAQLAAAVARDPSDIDARLALARLHLARRDMMSVWNDTTEVLTRKPGHPTALAYQSLVRLAMGQADAAVDLLNRAIASDPNQVDAYAYLVLAYARMGKMSDAQATVGRASKRFPDAADNFRRLLAEVQTQGSEMPSAAASAGEPDPHAGLDAPQDRPANSRPVAGPARIRIAGVIDIDPSLRDSISPSAVLFVFARQAGAAAGPPAAAKRLPATFPATFELSEADSMMGQPLPDVLLIEARLDEDGDPTTRPPTDPKARIDQVKAGRTDLRLVLKRQ